MALDPKSFADWEIALDAEKNMPDIYEIGRRLGLESRELLPYGHFMGKIDADAVMRRLENTPNGKYIDVTAITPTPLGEGKSTTTIGLVQGLGKRGRKAVAAIRQPSGGPTMGTKAPQQGEDFRSASPSLSIPWDSPVTSMPSPTLTIWLWLRFPPYATRAKL